MQKIEDQNSEISPAITCQVPDSIKENVYDDPKKDLEKRSFQKGSNYGTSPQTDKNIYETLKLKEEMDTSTEPIYINQNENSISEGINWMISKYYYKKILLLRY